jgi:hypothetical protein
MFSTKTILSGKLKLVSKLFLRSNPIEIMERLKGAGNIKYGDIENGNIENNIENGNIENNTSIPVMLLGT